MTLTLFFSVSLVLFILFVVTPKHLHLFEILLMWLLLIFIQNNLITLVALNTNLIKLSEKKQMVLTLLNNLFLLSTNEFICLPIKVGNSRIRFRLIY